ncbi:MAG: hypothetical protein M1819_003834 [Sarea resinae]|nr:MAG: hypothetical protein M1819_003834 [Sarea resinae]
MNPANFQNMAAAGGPGQVPVQRPNNGQVQQYILQTLRRQNLPPGWQSAVPVEERARWIFQIVHYLRQVRHNIELMEAVSIAIAFETKSLSESVDKTSYDTLCKEKLGQIQSTRQRQAAAMEAQQNAQMTMMQQTPMQTSMSHPGQNQFQQQFPPQMQHQMQMAQAPGQQPQQRVSMGMDGVNVPGPLHQQPQYQQMMQQMPMQQHTEAAEALTPQETGHVHMLAQRMASNATRDDLEKIKANLQNITAEQKEGLLRQGLDPVTYFFRSMALRQFKINKLKSQAQLNRQQPGQDLSGMGGMAGQQRPVSRTSMGAQGPQPGAGGPPTFDTFVGSMENFIGQQAEGLRSQEAGQLVVPASNSRPLPPQQMGGPPMGQAQQSQQGQANVSRPMPNSNAMAQHQQQMFNAQQAQKEKMQQVAQRQAQSQPQARASAQAKAQQIALQGQPGGMNSHMGQRPPQQSPAMSMLNRPLGPQGQQPPSQGTPQQRPQQMTPQMGQQQDLRFAQQAAQQAQQQTMAQAPTGTPITKLQLQNLPLALRQHIANLPEEQIKAVLSNWQQQQQAAQAQQQANRAAAMPQGSMAPQAPMTQAGQHMFPQGMQPNQNMNNAQFLANPELAFSQVPPTQQQMAGQALQNQQLQQRQQEQQRLQQQHQQQQYLRQQQAQNALMALTPERVREMDTKAFPRNILNTQNNNTIKVPEHVKTWGQLKEWVSCNPEHMPAASLEKLNGIQSMHWMNINPRRTQQGALNMMNQARPGVPPAGQAPPASMVPQGVPNGRVPGQPPGVPQMTQMPPNIPEPTAQELQSVRPRLPDHLKAITDDQLKRLVMSNRLRQAQAQAQANNARPPQLPPQQAAQMTAMQQMQQLQQQHQQMQQKQAQREASQKGAAGQQRQQPTPQQAQSQQQPQQWAQQQSDPHARTPVSTAAKSGRQAPSGRGAAQPPAQPQQAPKNLKRPSSDEINENANASQGQTLPAAPAVPNGKQQRPGVAGLTSEQLASMNPSQRAKFEAHVRQLAHHQQNGQVRGQQQPNQVANGGGPPNNEEAAQLERQRQRDNRLKQIVAEVIRSCPKRQPIDLNPQVKEVMTKKLREARDMVHRVEQSLPIFWRAYGEESMAREIISTRQVLIQQYNNKDPAEHFSITPQELDQSLHKLKEYFNFVMQKLQIQRQAQVTKQAHQQSNKQPGGPGVQSQSQAQPPPQSQPQPNAEASMHPLNAANLSKQQQALQLQRQVPNANNNSRPPAAPTTSQPPFALGASSPQGVPQAYGPNELTPDKLKFPPAKKRKPNQQGSAASTPAQGQNTTPGSTTSPQIIKTEQKRQQQETKPVPEATPTFRCPVLKCEFNKKGFASQLELAKHTSETHEVKEPPIADPLKFALESLAEGIGLNKDGTMKSPKEDQTFKVSPPEGSQKTQTTPSKHAPSIKGGKDIATPNLGAGTPSSRMQTGSKANSPAQTMLKTPQVANAKTPASGTLALKGTPSKSGKEADEKSEKRGSSGGQPSPWQESLISPENLMRCFEGLEELDGISSFTSLRSATPIFTPPSTKSNESSRDSDISEHDDLQINISGPAGTNWLEADVLSGDLGDLGIQPENNFWSLDQDLYDKPNMDPLSIGWSGSDEFDPTLFSVSML